MGKTFQAAHERFLTLDHFYFFDNCQTEMSQIDQKVQKSAKLIIVCLHFGALRS